MSEQYPLLSEELSEQEPPSPRYRRLLMSKERARHHVKGAAAIITRWPRQWTTLLTYWWIGIGMLAITTYIIYNSIFIYMTHSYKLHRTPMSFVHPANVLTSSKLTVPPKVFMHIFVNEKQEVNLDNYLSYIDIVTNKYKHIKFELILVHNDIFIETKKLNDKDRNELALNMLWGDNTVNEFVNHIDNLKIKYMTFSMYFDDSPLEKHWKNINPQLRIFFVRALSVWQKGGIAFDPIVLTPQSPNSLYIEKIYSILQKYNPNKGDVSSKFRELINKKNKSSKVQPNNIRDIINALEEETVTEKIIQEHLFADETKNNSTIYYERKTRSSNDINVTEIHQTKSVPVAQATVQKQENHRDNLKYNLLPMFIEYLFHNKPTKQPNETTPKLELVQATKSKPELVINKSNNDNVIIPTKDFWNEIIEQNKIKPVVISAKSVVEKHNNESKISNLTENVLENFEVTIDLKGNIIATDTVCHAFIGSLLSNAIHHNETETVTDFIIKELSSFCKGLLTSCVGIDVILL